MSSGSESEYDTAATQRSQALLGSGSSSESPSSSRYASARSGSDAEILSCNRSGISENPDGISSLVPRIFSSSTTPPLQDSSEEELEEDNQEHDDRLSSPTFGRSSSSGESDLDEDTLSSPSFESTKERSSHSPSVLKSAPVSSTNLSHCSPHGSGDGSGTRLESEWITADDPDVVSERPSSTLPSACSSIPGGNYRLEPKTSPPSKTLLRRPQLPSRETRTSELFVPSSIFHDNTGSEGMNYQNRAQENVKKYRSVKNRGQMDAPPAIKSGQLNRASGQSQPIDSHEPECNLAQSETGSSLTRSITGGSGSVTECLDESDTTDDEAATSYTHGHPLQRMPGKIKGFNECTYYHHKLYPKLKPGRYLHHHYLEPWQQLHLFGEAEASFDTSDTESSGPSSNASTDTDTASFTYSHNPNNQFEYDHDAKEMKGDAYSSSGSRSLENGESRKKRLSRNAFHLPLAMAHVWSETGHDTRILLRSVQTQINARRKVGGAPQDLLDAAAHEMLQERNYYVDGRNMVVFRPSKVTQEVAIKELPLASPELRLLLELNQLDVRRDPWNHAPPILDILELEPSDPQDPGPSLSDTEPQTVDIGVQLVFGHLGRLDAGIGECVEQYMDLFEQLLAGLTFLHDQRIVGLNCSSPDSFMMGQGNLRRMEVPRGDDTASLVSAYLGKGLPSSFSSIESPKTEVWGEEDAASPRYYFIDFSKARRLSPLGRPSSTEAQPRLPSENESGSIVSEGEAEKVYLGRDSSSEPRRRGPFESDVQKDVSDLGALFFDLIQSSPPNVKPTINAHYTCLVQAMTNGGFTADESRRLCDMISQKYEQGLRFTFYAQGQESPESRDSPAQTSSRLTSQTKCGEHPVVERDFARESASKAVANAALRCQTPECKRSKPKLLVTLGRDDDNSSEESGGYDLEEDISHPNYYYDGSSADSDGSLCDSEDKTAGRKRGRAGTIMADISVPSASVRLWEVESHPKQLD